MSLEGPSSAATGEMLATAFAAAAYLKGRRWEWPSPHFDERHRTGAAWSLILISPDGPYGAKLIEAGFDWRSLPMRGTTPRTFSASLSPGRRRG